jgi:hypothetical protein
MCIDVSVKIVYTVFCAVSSYCFSLFHTKDNARLREPVLRLRPLFVSLSICCPNNAQKNSNFQTEIIMNHLLKKYCDISI